jgi:hypothetical protein
LVCDLALCETLGGDGTARYQYADPKALGTTKTGSLRHLMITQCQATDFGVFCPKVISGIGKLPETINDRSIPIRLKRRLRGRKSSGFAQSWSPSYTGSLRRFYEKVINVKADVAFYEKVINVKADVASLICFPTSAIRPPMVTCGAVKGAAEGAAFILTL